MIAQLTAVEYFLSQCLRVHQLAIVRDGDHSVRSVDNEGLGHRNAIRTARCRISRVSNSQISFETRDDWFVEDLTDQSDTAMDIESVL